MYFESYDACLSAALKQSRGQLTDCKLYIKGDKDQYWRIGFTPDHEDDGFIYNGEFKKAEKVEG